MFSKIYKGYEKLYNSPYFSSTKVLELSNKVLLNKSLPFSFQYRQSFQSKQSFTQAIKVQCMLIWVGQFASTIKCTHIGFVPGYCLSQILKKSSLKKETEITSMRTRALPSQLPVGLRRMTWAPRCLVISAASTY